MRRVKISQAAQRDLKAIARYIADQSGGDIARGVIDGVRKHCDRIAALPGSLGTARPELGADLRSTPHHRYIIYFRYTEDALEVINVRDARRDTYAHFAEQDTDLCPPATALALPRHSLYIACQHKWPLRKGRPFPFLRSIPWPSRSCRTRPPPGSSTIPRSASSRSPNSVACTSSRSRRSPTIPPRPS